MTIDLIKRNAVDELNRLHQGIDFLKFLLDEGRLKNFEEEKHIAELSKLQQELKIKYDAYIVLGFNIYFDGELGRYVIEY